MDGIPGYILSVAVAAVFCALIQSFFSPKSTCGAIMKLVCGLVMAMVFLSPWIDLDLGDYLPILEEYSAEAAAVTERGTESAEESARTIIKDSTQAYILDKAEEMDLDLIVQVELTNTSPPTPETVTLDGNIAPLDRQKLTDLLCDELGLQRENIIWK